jgi:hypothetical protein
MGPFKKSRVFQLQFLRGSAIAELSKINKVSLEKEKMKKRAGNNYPP